MRWSGVAQTLVPAAFPVPSAAAVTGDQTTGDGSKVARQGCTRDGKQRDSRAPGGGGGRRRLLALGARLVDKRGERPSRRGPGEGLDHVTGVGNGRQRKWMPAALHASAEPVEKEEGRCHA